MVSIMNRHFTVNLRITSNKWACDSNAAVCGNAFLRGRLMDAKELAAAKIKGVDAVRELNGFFALVNIEEENLFASADIMRSIPLFYYAGERLWISDDPYWIKDEVSSSVELLRDDIASKYELTLTRYVTGSYTLTEGIRQLQAGEALMAEYKDGKVIIRTSRYYKFETCVDTLFNNIERRKLFKMHDEILLEAFDRFKNLSCGRTVVIPLSGGYDSRILAVMLKIINYKKIIAFSYGKKDNPEALISRNVAKNLGIPWYFIEYDRDMVYKYINSKEWRNYNKMADGNYCVCFDREYAAIAELKRRRLIPDDSIIIPGHSGDFTAGGHIPISFVHRRKVKTKKLLYEILNRHYTMWRFDRMHEDNNVIKEMLESRIMEASGLGKVSSGYISSEKAISMYEKWVWQEFEAKYLINSVRVYEFWGYNWWMPLLDAEYIRFWSSMPKDQRYLKKLYDRYVSLKYSDVAGISRAEALIRNDKTSVYAVILSRIMRWFTEAIGILPLRPVLRFFRNLIRGDNMSRPIPAKEDIKDDWEQFLCRLNPEVYKKLRPYMTCRNSCATLEKSGYIRYDAVNVSDNVISMLESLAGLKKPAGR